MTPRRILRRRIPTQWQQFYRSPILYITKKAYAASTSLRPAPIDRSPHHARNQVRVVCIADTHGNHSRVPPLPEGDVLIHAGDLTQNGTVPEVLDALHWLSAAPHKHKIFIAGNHDKALADPLWLEAFLAAHPDLIYLQDSCTVLSFGDRELTVYGSPGTPARGSPRRGVFHYARHQAARQWANIPRETDILITHTPPRDILDVAGFGCNRLLERLLQVRPRLHVCGHIHLGRGAAHIQRSSVLKSYLRVVKRKGGWGHAWQVVREALRRVLWGPGAPVYRARVDTVVVNAASVGGLWDELTFGAIAVDVPLARRRGWAICHS
ncbi:metallophosphoesterase domain-containing protein 1 [Trametes elegans]|nr:metallophosphoesterase domain-containing protein 1 [Trametes elegans]